MSILGDRLKSEREKRGWSQVLVASKLGLKRSSTYANWEYGTREPDLEMIQKLADLYNVSIDWLNGRNFREEDNPLPEEVILGVIKEAESEYKVNLRDDPLVESAVRDLIHNLAKMKQANQKKK